jgi:bifunctional NMN adenylyltransferase/nudix hydrolase
MNYDYIVYIGRFQPPHLAHIEIMKQALKQGEHLIVLAGSAIQPRTIKNPWTWQERSHMIVTSLPQSIRGRVTVKPLRDILYNDQQWAQQVQALVSEEVSTAEALYNAPAGSARVGIIGYSKDESSYYLSMFPQWDLIDVGNIEDIHATDIRTALFTMEDDDFDLHVGRNLPPAIHDYLKAFTLRPEFEQLVREHTFIETYKKAWEVAPYAPTFVTVDAVVIQSGHVLLVRRRAEPGRGLFAMPGGFVDPVERIRDAVIRELREETKIKVPGPVLAGSVKAQDVYDHPSRSLRGRTITHAFLIELPAGPLPKVKGSDDADKAKWVPLSVFKTMEDQMFEDHFHIINDMIGKL